MANTESVNPKGWKKPSQRNLTKYPFHYIAQSTIEPAITNPQNVDFVTQQNRHYFPSQSKYRPLFNVSTPPLLPPTPILPISLIPPPPNSLTINCNQGGDDGDLLLSASIPTKKIQEEVPIELVPLLQTVQNLVKST